MSEKIGLICLEAIELQAVNRTEFYENNNWFVSQVFEPDWVPRTPYDTS